MQNSWEKGWFGPWIVEKRTALARPELAWSCWANTRWPVVSRQGNRWSATRNTGVRGGAGCRRAWGRGHQSIWAAQGGEEEARGTTDQGVTLWLTGWCLQAAQGLVSVWRGLWKGYHQAKAVKSQRGWGPLAGAGSMGCFTPTLLTSAHQKLQEASFFCNVPPVPSTEKADHRAQCWKEFHWLSQSI